MKIWILECLVLYGTNVTALRNEAEYVNTQVLVDLFSQEYLCSKCFNHLVLKRMVFSEQKVIFILVLMLLFILVTLMHIVLFIHNYKTLTIEIYCPVRPSPGILHHTAV